MNEEQDWGAVARRKYVEQTAWVISLAQIQPAGATRAQRRAATFVTIVYFFSFWMPPAQRKLCFKCLVYGSQSVIPNRRLETKVGCLNRRVAGKLHGFRGADNFPFGKHVAPCRAT
jgi:hypothetical protein